MKIVQQLNHRVCVEPWVIGKYDANYAQRKADEMMAEIKRHVDNIGNIWVEVDTVISCSHCGYNWEVDEETKEPLCCQKAIDEFHEELHNIE